MLNVKQFLNVQRLRGLEVTSRDSSVGAGGVQSQTKILKKRRHKTEAKISEKESQNTQDCKRVGGLGAGYFET